VPRASSSMNVAPGAEEPHPHNNSRQTATLQLPSGMRKAVCILTGKEVKVNLLSIMYAFRVIVRCIALFAATCEWQPVSEPINN
jgi:hypothetical protein